MRSQRGHCHLFRVLGHAGHDVQFFQFVRAEAFGQGGVSYVARLAGCQRLDAFARREEELPVDPNVKEVEEQLQRALGLKVHVEDNRGRGKVIIEYASLADFDGLLEKLGTGD